MTRYFEDVSVGDTFEPPGTEVRRQRPFSNPVDAAQKTALVAPYVY